ncbi:MAG: hypothetical protein ABII39_02745 [Candidatus Micrarchaeota archaeon]
MTGHTFAMNRDQYMGSFDGARNDVGHITVSRNRGRGANNDQITITDSHGRNIGSGTYNSGRNPPYLITLNDATPTGRALITAMQAHGLNMATELTPAGNVASATFPTVPLVDQQAPAQPRAQPRPHAAVRAREAFQENSRGQARTYTLTPAQVQVARERLAAHNISLDTDLNGTGLRHLDGTRIGSVVERGNIGVTSPLRDSNGRVRRHYNPGADDGVILGVNEDPNRPRYTVRDGTPTYIPPSRNRPNANPNNPHDFTGTPVMGGTLVSAITISLSNSESSEAFNEAVAVLDGIPGVRAQRTPTVPEPRSLTGNQARVTLTGRQFDDLTRDLTAVYDDDEENNTHPHRLVMGRRLDHGMAQELVFRDPQGNLLARGVRYEGSEGNDDQVVLTFNDGRTLEQGTPVNGALARVDALGMVERREVTPAGVPADQDQRVAQAGSTPTTQPVTVKMEQSDFLRFERQIRRDGYRIDASGDQTVVRNRSGDEVGRITFDRNRFNPDVPISTVITSSDQNLIAALNRVSNSNATPNNGDTDRRLVRH